MLGTTCHKNPGDEHALLSNALMSIALMSTALMSTTFTGIALMSSALTSMLGLLWVRAKVFRFRVHVNRNHYIFGCVTRKLGPVSGWGSFGFVQRFFGLGFRRKGSTICLGA